MYCVDRKHVVPEVLEERPRRDEARDGEHAEAEDRADQAVHLGELRGMRLHVEVHDPCSLAVGAAGAGLVERSEPFPDPAPDAVLHLEYWTSGTGSPGRYASARAAISLRRRR